MINPTTIGQYNLISKDHLFTILFVHSYIESDLSFKSTGSYSSDVHTQSSSGMEAPFKNRIVITGLIIFLIAIVFLIDCLLPIGIIVWIFYLIPVGLASIFFKRRIPLIIIGICAVLLFLVVILEPSGRITLLEYALFNRTLGVVTFLFVHFLIAALLKTHKRISETNKRFDIAGSHRLRYARFQCFLPDRLGQDRCKNHSG